MSGFDCLFIEEPPQVLQTHCSICLLVLREPFQVTCCGKSFCRECIQRVIAGGTPCPTCNEARYDSFQNKGLQQPLYGFRVFCSNKESGCDWQEELGQLDQHLNVNPDKDKQFQGCAYTEVKCLYCNEPHPRHEIEHHQTSQCAKRPFTCSLCEEYESTYTDVVTNHSPVCKCRPVECPNSCGTNNLQQQHLEEHVSTQCPLTYVECEFSDAGCDAKVYRKDLPSHLGENMVTHMSLLARENRKLKQQLREQDKKIRNRSSQQEGKIWEHEVKMAEQQEKIEGLSRQLKLLLSEQGQASAKLDMAMQKQSNDTISFLSHVPPLYLRPLIGVVPLSGVWFSKPFYSHIGGYKLQLEIRYTAREPREWGLDMRWQYKYKCKYNLLDSEFTVHPSGTIFITTQIIQDGKGTIHTLQHRVTCGGAKENLTSFEIEPPYIKGKYHNFSVHIPHIKIKI